MAKCSSTQNPRASPLMVANIYLDFGRPTCRAEAKGQGKGGSPCPGKGSPLCRGKGSPLCRGKGPTSRGCSENTPPGNQKTKERDLFYFVLVRRGLWEFKKPFVLNKTAAKNKKNKWFFYFRCFQEFPRGTYRVTGYPVWGRPAV